MMIRLLGLILLVTCAACQQSQSVPAQQGRAAADVDRRDAGQDRKGAENAVNRGIAAFGRSDGAAAIAEYTEAIRLDPACVKAYFLRGEARRNFGELDGAADDYTHAIRLDPKWAMPYLSRAAVYRGIGQYKKVIADCTEAIRFQPDLTLAYYVRGQAYTHRRDFDKAIADYTEVVRLDPKDCGAYHERGMVYKEMRENGKAEADLKRAKELGYGQCGGYGRESGTVPAQQRMTPEASTIPAQQLMISTAEKELMADLGKGVKLEMVRIPAGEFMMGSRDSDDCADDTEKPQHRVSITKPFYLGKCLVTQEQWKAAMGNNPSNFKGPKNPVEMVSWDDCQQFLEKLNTKIGTQGWKFVLPSEAQWEYACRAGSTTRYCFGDDHSGLDEYAWYGANSGKKTHPVGEKKANAWGLYDMHGNVWEWCQDWYDRANYKESPVGPPGPTGNRVQRGGSWEYPEGLCRSANRAGRRRRIESIQAFASPWSRRTSEGCVGPPDQERGRNSGGGIPGRVGGALGSGRQ